MSNKNKYSKDIYCEKEPKKTFLDIPWNDCQILIFLTNSKDEQHSFYLSINQIAHHLPFVRNGSTRKQNGAAIRWELCQFIADRKFGVETDISQCYCS